MRRPRRYAFVALLVLTAALVTLTVSAALRDNTPPQLYVEAPARLAVGAPLGLFVSADEPVTYTLEYGGQSHELIEQDATFTVTAVAGAQLASLRAVDGAGNETVHESLIVGVPALAPTLQVAELVTSGDPLGLHVLGLPAADADPVANATVTDLSLQVAGAAIPLRQVGADYRGMLASPMTVDARTIEAHLTVVDEFARRYDLTAQIVLEPLPVEVEQLRLSAATLSVITPEGRALEADTIAHIMAGARPDPLWTAPFTMPIEGVSTSGFGDARRYEQGGPASFHYGLDLGVPQGTPIHATNDGVVVVAGPYPIKGGWVAIDHGDGLISHYFHMSRVDAVVGQQVHQGDVIGLVGTTGLSTGPHLHWEMRVRGEASNPLAWVGKTYP